MSLRFNKQKGNIVFFGLSLLFILAVTVLNRHPRGFYNYSVYLFWSYRRAFQGEWKYIWEVTSNILLFFPEGFFGALLLKDRNKPVWPMVLLGFLLSVGIEAAQYYWQLGFAELDDVFSNTLGTVLGALAAKILSKWFIRTIENVNEDILYFLQNSVGESGKTGNQHTQRR